MSNDPTPIEQTTLIRKLLYVISLPAYSRILLVAAGLKIFNSFKYGRPGLFVTRGKLPQWLYWEKNLLERSTGHILDVSVNANSFCVQCSVMESAALTRDRVLHYFLRQVKIYSRSFHVIDIKRLFRRNKLLYYLERSRTKNIYVQNIFEIYNIYILHI